MALRVPAPMLRVRNLRPNAFNSLLNSRTTRPVMRLTPDMPDGKPYALLTQS